MRDVKFRAWDKVNHVIRPVFDIIYHQNGTISSWLGCGSSSPICLTTPNYELMQFTGLKDKDGKEIYEGDIVKSNSGIIYAITFNSELAQFEAVKKNIVLDPPMWPFSAEIIGNIYENPQLLEVAK